MKNVLKEKRLILIFLAVLIFAGTFSFLRWKRDYEVYYGEYCPDQYCEYADTFREFFLSRNFGSFQKLEKFYQTRYISFSPIAPLLTSVISILTGNMILSYSLVSILFSLGTVFVFFKMISKYLDVPMIIKLLSVILLLIHILFIRSFLRPITDSTGLFFTFTSLYLVLDVTKSFCYKKLFYYCLFIYLSLFARVSLFPVVIFIMLWFLLKFIQKRNIQFLESTITLSILPAIIFIITGAAFGFLGMILKAWDVAHDASFLASYNFFDLFKVLLVSLQFYPIIWLYAILKKKFLRTEAEVFHFLWILFYISFLLIGKGALWNRYMLPIVPSIIFVSIKGLGRLFETKRVYFYLTTALLILFSILPIIIQIIDPHKWRSDFVVGFFY